MTMSCDPLRLDSLSLRSPVRLVKYCSSLPLQLLSSYTTGIGTASDAVSGAILYGQQCDDVVFITSYELIGLRTLPINAAITPAPTKEKSHLLGLAFTYDPILAINKSAKGQKVKYEQIDKQSDKPLEIICAEEAEAAAETSAAASRALRNSIHLTAPLKWYNSIASVMQDRSSCKSPILISLNPVTTLIRAHALDSFSANVALFCSIPICPILSKKQYSLMRIITHSAINLPDETDLCCKALGVSSSSSKKIATKNNTEDSQGESVITNNIDNEENKKSVKTKQSLHQFELYLPHCPEQLLPALNALKEHIIEARDKNRISEFFKYWSAYRQFIKEILEPHSKEELLTRLSHRLAWTQTMVLHDLEMTKHLFAASQEIDEAEDIDEDNRADGEDERFL